MLSVLRPRTLAAGKTVAPKIWAVPVRHGSTRHKVMSAEDAAYLVQDGDTITVSGFVIQNSPEEILSALGRRFQETKSPKDLTLFFGAGAGDGDKRGLNWFAQEGFLKRVVGAHYRSSPHPS